MEKLFIKNRKGQKIAVVVEQPQDQAKGLAFVMHGLGSFKESPQVLAIAEAFVESNYTTVRFDTTNTLGESDGDFSDATVTNYYQDLEDVIAWSKTQNWYQEPFILSGLSLGGLCTGLYAEHYPSQVKAWFGCGTTISGELSFSKIDPEILKNWKETGFLISESVSKPGVIRKLKWTEHEDRLKYDLLLEINKLTMVTKLVVGEFDESEEVGHQKLLYNSLPSKDKELIVVKGVPHTFRESVHLQELKQIFDQWIKKLD